MPAKPSEGWTDQEWSELSHDRQVGITMGLVIAQAIIVANAKGWYAEAEALQAGPDNSSTYALAQRVMSGNIPNHGKVNP